MYHLFLWRVRFHCMEWLGWVACQSGQQKPRWRRSFAVSRLFPAGFALGQTRNSRGCWLRQEGCRGVGRMYW